MGIAVRLTFSICGKRQSSFSFINRERSLFRAVCCHRNPMTVATCGSFSRGLQFVPRTVKLSIESHFAIRAYGDFKRASQTSSPKADSSAWLAKAVGSASGLPAAVASPHASARAAK